MGSYLKVLLSALHIWRDLLHKQGEARFNQTEALITSDESLLNEILAFHPPNGSTSEFPKTRPEVPLQEQRRTCQW